MHIPVPRWASRSGTSEHATVQDADTPWVHRVHAFLARVPRDRVDEYGERILYIQVVASSGPELHTGYGHASLPAQRAGQQAWALVSRFATSVTGERTTVAEAHSWLDDAAVDAEQRPDGRAVNAIRTGLAAVDRHSAAHANGVQDAASAPDYRELFTWVTRVGWWPEAPPPTVEGRSPNTYGRWNARDLNGTRIESHLPERAALAFGLSTVRHNHSRFTAIDPDGKETAFNVTGSAACGMAAHAISQDKEATRFLLGEGGVPVPVGRSFPPDAVDDALDYAQTIGYPVTVKPLAGKRGVAVFTDISSREQATNAIQRVRQSEFGKEPFILEEHIHGDGYRVFVVGDRVDSMVRYEHGTITGNGAMTVGELLLQKDLIRWPNPHLRERRIQLDDAVMQRLSDQGLTLDAVLEDQERVIFTANPNFNQGGESIEILDETHPSILQAAVRAVQLVPGTSFSGLDFIIPDHTAALDSQRAAICEINAHPVLGSGVFPLYGPQRNLPGSLMRHVAQLDGLRISNRPASELCVRLTVSGKVQGVFYRKWFSERAQKAGLRGWVRNTTNRKVQAVVAGPVEAVAGLVSAAAHGSKNAEPRAVHTVHVNERAGDDFQLRDTAAEET